jgi:hypothetical protein
MWPVEEIPDEDFVFLRVHKSFMEFGEDTPKGIFKDHEGGMSTDWDKYSTAQNTQSRAKCPSDNGVLKLNVGGVGAISGLSVVHEPLPANRAHTEVFGEKNVKSRLLLQRLSEWVIRP